MARRATDAQDAQDLGVESEVNLFSQHSREKNVEFLNVIATIDEMVTLKAAQSEDDSRKEYGIKSFDETRGRGQRSSHKDAVKSYRDQTSKHR